MKRSRFPLCFSAFCLVMAYANAEVTEDKNAACFDKFTMQAHVAFVAGVNTVNHNFNVPSDVVIREMSCNGPERFIKLSWPTAAPENNMTIFFNYNEETKESVISNFDVALASAATDKTAPAAPLVFDNCKVLPSTGANYACASSRILSVDGAPQNVTLKVTAKLPKLSLSNESVDKKQNQDTTKQPMAEKEEAPVTVTKSVTEKSPVVTEKSPVVAEKSPVVAEKSPVVTEKSPVDAEKSPVVAEKSAPVTKMVSADPAQNKWSYSVNNVTCLLVEFNAKLKVTYNAMVKNETKHQDAHLEIPLNATVTGGSCGAENQSIVISWDSNMVALNYSLHSANHTYGLTKVTVLVVPDEQHFPNATSYETIILSHTVEEWVVPEKASFHCAAPTPLSMNSETAGGEVATITLDDLQMEAFRTTNNTEFSAARDCSSDVPDAVPIVVGCVLGSLVVLVLVAYVVARRRSHARGYLSM